MGTSDRTHLRRRRGGVGVFAAAAAVVVVAAKGREQRARDEPVPYLVRRGGGDRERGGG